MIRSTTITYFAYRPQTQGYHCGDALPSGADIIYIFLDLCVYWFPSSFHYQDRKGGENECSKSQVKFTSLWELRPGGGPPYLLIAGFKYVAYLVPRMCNTMSKSLSLLALRVHRIAPQMDL